MRKFLQKQLQWVKDLWLILGVTLFFFLSFELLAQVLFHFRDSSAARAVIDHRSTADTYLRAGWPSDYYSELADSSAVKWASYVYWKRTPFGGQYINIDKQGNRVTWSAGLPTLRSTNDVNILMLGGSTMWGLGSRDEFTIPSLLAKKLAEHGVRARVTNLGQIGYVSTQEVIALLLELQKGNIPDIVIFYDGFNDTMSAYQMGEAGLPQNEFNRIHEFNSSKISQTVPSLPKLAGALSSVRLANALLYRAGFIKTAEASTPSQTLILDSYAAGQAEPLARDVVAIFRKNVEAAKALSTYFGFKIVFYWQPIVFEKMNLTAYEQEDKRVHAKFQWFFGETYRTMRDSNLAANNVGVFHDLSRIFFDTAEPLFVDWCHLGETGNALIADKMTMDVLPMIQRKAAAMAGR